MALIPTGPPIPSFPLVIIESPYAGEVETNERGN